MILTIPQAKTIGALIIEAGYFGDANEIIDRSVGSVGWINTYAKMVAIDSLANDVTVALVNPSIGLSVDLAPQVIGRMGNDELQHIWDLMTQAVDGGSDYWLDDHTDTINVKVIRNDAGDVTSISFDSDCTGTKTSYTVTAQDVLHAAYLVHAHPEIFRDDIVASIRTMFSDEWDFDADVADYLIQLASFKELVYG